MTALLVIRHAPTDWNKAGLIQGRTDRPLDAAALERLRAARLPTGWAGAACQSSPLRRAMETARLLGLDPKSEPRLIEMAWGEWEGRTLPDLRAELGGAMAENESRGLDFRPPGGESPRDVQYRLRPLLEGLSERMIWVTHKGVLRALYALATGWTMARDAPDKLRDRCTHAFEVTPGGIPSVVDLNIPPGAAVVKQSVLFHVQHLLGIGHLRRAEILARRMANGGLDVTVAYGGLRLSEAPFRDIRVAELPAATIANEDFLTLRDADGRPVDEGWKAARRNSLLDIWRRTDPDVVLIELFPFGRRQFRFELIPLLEAIHAAERRPAVACSVRDILVATNKPGRDDETIATLRRFFDAVLVHGDPTLIPFGSTFGGADRIADLIRYTGYIAAEQTTEARDAKGEVIVSAGGGAVGAPILFAALAARPLTPIADNIWRFLTGPNLPDSDLDKLAAQAGPRTVVERFRLDFAARLRVAALSISQGGYNTTMDILQSKVPAVVVPFETKSETEQRLRAELLAGKGVLTLVPTAELSPERLATAVRSALNQSWAAPRIDLTGASTTARIVGELAARRAVERR